MIGYLIKRNLRIFFRDRATVFFSLLGVFIIIGLYVLFLGNMLESYLERMPQVADDARFLMDSWIMGGVVAAASITTCMGAFGIMIDDTQKHIIKDFRVSPIQRWQLVLGYILSAITIGIIMSIFTFALAEIYIVVYGGKIVPPVVLLKIIGLIVISVSTSSSIVFFLTTLIKGQNAFGTASTILGTLIGFMTGIYIPIGQLPLGVQAFIKLFPVSHSAVLIRQELMNEAVPLDYLPDETLEFLGVNFKVAGKFMADWQHLLVLVATCILFYGLSLVVVSRKKAHE